MVEEAPGRRVSACLIIENYRYKECPRPRERFQSIASLHNHTSHSMEDLAPLNAVTDLRFMRPFKGVLQNAFGLEWVTDIDYRDLQYRPPLAPHEVLGQEIEDARKLGIDRALVAITDHDEISGAQEIARTMPGNRDQVILGEEVSFKFHQHIFHLGLLGFQETSQEAQHAELQRAARTGTPDDLFDLLRTLDCLVILNHPLLPAAGIGHGRPPTEELLRRYASAIHALEYNGMRSLEENDRVIALARSIGKPLVGGGDSHSLTPSSAVSGCEGTDGFAGFFDEIKSGFGVPLIKPGCFSPPGWKITLRTLNFIAHYRRVAYYKREPIEKVLRKKRVLLDPVGTLAHGFLRATEALGLLR